jgi:glutaredoxin
MTRRGWVVWVVLCFLLSVACKKADPRPTQGGAPLVVSEAATDLLLTWLDERGEFHVEQKVADVPLAARDLVRVVDPTRESPPEQVFVVDLRTPGPDGTYPVRTIAREELEAFAAERRKAHGSVLAAQAPAASDARPSAPTVIIYGASWCGPCHQAAAYLKSKGVAFVEKDIEADTGAAREMQAKLAKAGRPGGSIPVLDIGGKILIGFDRHAVDAALGR